MGSAGAPRRVAGVVIACAIAFACGGRIDSTSSDPDRAGTGRASSSREPDPNGSAAGGSNGSSSTADASASVDGSSPGPAGCSSLGAKCQVFEPDGAQGRWGCHTVGPLPELACERAAGSAVARCNCEGRFGESPPGVVDGTPWFEIPATSVWPSESEFLDVWRTRCGGAWP